MIDCGEGGLGVGSELVAVRRLVEKEFLPLFTRQERQTYVRLAGNMGFTGEPTYAGQSVLLLVTWKQTQMEGDAVQRTLDVSCFGGNAMSKENDAGILGASLIRSSMPRLNALTLPLFRTDVVSSTPASIGIGAMSSNL